MTLIIGILLSTILSAQEPLSIAARAMREGRFAEAERIYRQLLKDSPNDSRLRLNLGLALHSAKKYSEALPELERYLKATPQPGPVHLLVGAARLKLNKSCEAIAPLETARKWKQTPEVLVELADAYSGCRRWTDAAETYKALAAIEPKEPKYAWAAARAYWQARDYQQAKPIYSSLEPVLSSNAHFEFEYGDTLARLEGAESGLAHLQKAVSADPGLIAARGSLGRALLELNRSAEAIPHLEAAARQDVTLLLPLSRAYKAVGRLEEAARTEAEYRRKASNQN